MKKLSNNQTLITNIISSKYSIKNKNIFFRKNKKENEESVSNIEFTLKLLNNSSSEGYYKTYTE
jgi:hypothetical protein